MPVATLAANPSEVAKTLRPGSSVQAVQAPLRMPHQAARQRIAPERGKSGLTKAAPRGVDIYPPLSLTTGPRITEPAAIKNARKLQATEALQQQKSTQATTRLAAAASFTPLCPTLDINVLYTLTGSQVGNSTCYHFAITQRSKSLAVLTGQNANTDLALMLLKDDGANNLSVVGTSDVIGNGDEYILAVTEPGNYYWWMEPYAADGSAINFGVQVSAPIDAYELNDAVALATVLPDKSNTIIGNSDTTTDYDYYQFTSVRGQDVVIHIDGVNTGTSNRWILELSGNGTSWQTLGSAEYTTIRNLQQNQPLFVRVSPNPTAPWNAAEQYILTFGTAAASGEHRVSGESNLLQIPRAASPGTLSTQVYRTLTWISNIKDSKGAPVNGVTAYMRLWPKSNDPQNSKIYEITTSNNGIGSKTIDLGICSGDRQAYFTDSSSGQPYNWEAYFNLGAWNITIDGTDSGVGGLNVPTVALGHICSMRIIP